MARLNLFKLTHIADDLNIDRNKVYRWNLGVDSSLSKEEKKRMLNHIQDKSKQAIKLLTAKIKQDEK